jgi:hypothetical protein
VKQSRSRRTALRLCCAAGAAALGAATSVGACGSSTAGGTGSAEGYLYVNSDCDPTSGPSYVIVDSAMPPPSYEAVPDASVTLFTRSGQDGRWTSVKTSANGHFAIRDMPAGSASVRCDPPTPEGPVAPFSPVFTVTLEGGRTARHFEASSAGTFAASLAYDCDASAPLVWVSGSSAPLSNARVETGHSDRCPIAAETDASGHILLENLQAGTYELRILVEPCGVSVVCHVDIPGGEPWCESPQATASVSPASLAVGGCVS